MSRIFVKNLKVDVVNMGNELAMMNTETGKYVIINEVGKDIWSLIDGEKSEEDIINALLELYDIDEETCSNEVNTFIRQLIDEKLVTKVS